MGIEAEQIITTTDNNNRTPQEQNGINKLENMYNHFNYRHQQQKPKNKKE